MAKIDPERDSTSGATIVRQIRQSLHDGRVDRDGTLIPRGGGRCCVRATQKCLRHALAMLETVIAETQRAGHKASLDGRLLKIAVADEVIHLFVREKIIRKDHVPLPDERWAPRYDLQPTGLLRVCIEASWLSPRTLWDESAGRPPNRMTPKLLNGLSRAAVAMQNERLAQERREAEYRMKRKLEDELEAKRAVQRQHAEHLEGLAERWEHSRRVRAFIAAVRESRQDLGPPRGWQGSLAEWLRWAELYADQMDPLIPSTGADSPLWPPGA